MPVTFPLFFLALNSIKNCSFRHLNKKLLSDNGLPDIRWHDLRSTFCTLLLKNDFNPKAVSKLMGHAKEIITMDVYGDNQGIIADCIPEISDFIDEVLPKQETDDKFQEELLEVVVDTSEYLWRSFLKFPIIGGNKCLLCGRQERSSVIY